MNMQYVPIEEQKCSQLLINLQTFRKTDSNSKNKQKISSQSSKISRWTEEENTLYVRFLKRFCQRLKKKGEKKFNKFERMAFYVESKTSNQCRSHHQKMMIRFQSIQNIIQGLTGQKYFCEQENIGSQIQVPELSDLSVRNQVGISTNNQIQKELEKQNFDSTAPLQDDEIFNVLG